MAVFLWESGRKSRSICCDYPPSIWAMYIYISDSSSFWEPLPKKLGAQNLNQVRANCCQVMSSYKPPLLWRDAGLCQILWANRSYIGRKFCLGWHLLMTIQTVSASFCSAWMWVTATCCLYQVFILHVLSLSVSAWARNNIRTHWRRHIGTFGHQNQWQKWVSAHIIIVLWSNLASKFRTGPGLITVKPGVCVWISACGFVGFR